MLSENNDILPVRLFKLYIMCAMLYFTTHSNKYGDE